MIMETVAGAALSDVLKFNGIAGNAVFNMYAAVDPDSSTGSSNYAGSPARRTSKNVTVITPRTVNTDWKARRTIK